MTANPVKHVRVSDHPEFILDKDNGFKNRKRTPIEQIFFLFVFIGVVALGTSIIVYYDSLTGTYICFGLGVVLWFVGRQLEKLKTLLQVSEFMNALFSSALAKKFKFVCIVRLNGDIIYFNRSFQEYFPDFGALEKRTITTLLDTGNISDEHREAVMNALTQTTESRTSVILHAGADKAAKPFTLSIDPIERPLGFVLLRGE